jgi:hypothetical protein
MTSCGERVFCLRVLRGDNSLTVGPVGQGVEEVPGWVRLVDQADKWLPVSGHGHVYLHEQK